MITTKSDVLFTTIKPAGFRLLSALERTSRRLSLDFVITSACDGVHSGPQDPHHLGEAYDIRTHSFSNEQKDTILRVIFEDLASDRGEGIETTSGGLATGKFFGFVESRGTANEHIHLQRRNNRIY